jgi:hypothetical protein
MCRKYAFQNRTEHIGHMLSEKQNIPQSQPISTTRIHCLVLLYCLRDHVPFVVLPENMES